MSIEDENAGNLGSGYLRCEEINNENPRCDEIDTPGSVKSVAMVCWELRSDLNRGCSAIRVRVRV